VDARAVVDAVAGVIAYALRRNALQAGVQRRDIDLRPCVSLCRVERWIAEQVRQERIVDL
jgi:hypothetical protein